MSRVCWPRRGRQWPACGPRMSSQGAGRPTRLDPRDEGRYSRRVAGSRAMWPLVGGGQQEELRVKLWPRWGGGSQGVPSSLHWKAQAPGGSRVCGGRAYLDRCPWQPRQVAHRAGMLPARPRRLPPPPWVLVLELPSSRAGTPCWNKPENLSDRLPPSRPAPRPASHRARGHGPGHGQVALQCLRVLVVVDRPVQGHQATCQNRQ